MTLGSSMRSPWLALPLVAFVTLAAAQVWLSHQRYELAKQHQQLVVEMQDMQAELKRLRLELASLTRPERLRQWATEKLDMHPPAPHQVVHL